MASKSKAQGNPVKADSGLSIKVSEKGAVSVYGLGRFPVTLYKEQWFAVLNNVDGIREFIIRHDDELKEKPAASRVEGAEAL